MKEVIAGTNVRFAIEGEDLVIRVKASERNGLTSSQKSHNVASSEGFVKVPGTPMKFQLNVIEPVAGGK